MSIDSTYDAPTFNDADLDAAGVPVRPADETRSEVVIVARAAAALTAASGDLRRRLLTAVLGDQRIADLDGRLTAAGSALDHLVFVVPAGAPAPDLVVGLPDAVDGVGRLTVYAIIEGKLGAADNAHVIGDDDDRDALGAWEATWTTRGGKTIRAWVTHQCTGYKVNAARWLARQGHAMDQRRWVLADDVEWLLISETERDWTPDGWAPRGWGPLLTVALATVGDGTSDGAAVVGSLLRSWVAPAGSRPFRVEADAAAPPRNYGSLRAAAIVGWQANVRRIAHRARDSSLLVSSQGGWWIVDTDDVALAVTDPEYLTWRRDLTKSGELHADDVCPTCGVPARRCGHIDRAGFSWPGVSPEVPKPAPTP